MITAWKDINELLVLDKAIKKDGRHLKPEDLEVIPNAALVFDETQVLFQGPTSALPPQYHTGATSLNGEVVTPEIVDSHTHLVFAGDRSHEYVMRLNGADYQAIANAGGGILSTMNSTLKASSDELFNLAVARVEKIASYGVTTIEVKSGYALTFEDEYRLSHVIARLKQHFAPRLRIFNTFMAAHAVPKSFHSSSEYLKKVVLPLLDKLTLEDIIDAVDIFHEQGYFSKDDVVTLFEKASSLNLPVKIHADEFADNGGAALAAKYNALSADHLLCTGASGIQALAASKTVATLLPGTGYFLGKKQADARALLDAGAKVAIASDFNPGSCHIDNVLMLASLSAINYKMNQCEMWMAITHNARDALGYKASPRFTRLKAKSISHISYSWGLIS